MNLILWQTIYLLGGLVVLPFAPFLYIQAYFTRRSIGRIPDAGGPPRGVFENGAERVRLLVLGESTAAGMGARTHETALAGQFAGFLGRRIGKTVEWHVVGRSGITVKETIRDLVPQIPDGEFDYVMLALCGNEVLKLHSPRVFRRDLTALLAILRERYDGVTIFLTNAPAVRLSPVLPQPIRFLLGHLSALHDANAREFTPSIPRVYYFHQPTSVPPDFFADGIHPSEKGYTVWSKRMLEFFEEYYGWRPDLSEKREGV
ncbi:MAG: SGNH/GDSL hydrolase family protein [Acidobacteria bacterium]|nr:SGNH/GDSL hydrolase family protein [Acidobacteriota bacterium]